MKLNDIVRNISHSVHNVGDVLYSVWGLGIKKDFFYQVVEKNEDGYRLRPFYKDGSLFRRADKNYTEAMGGFNLVRAPSEDYKNLDLLDVKDYEAK